MSAFLSGIAIGAASSSVALAIARLRGALGDRLSRANFRSGAITSALLVTQVIVLFAKIGGSLGWLLAGGILIGAPRFFWPTVESSVRSMELLSDQSLSEEARSRRARASRDVFLVGAALSFVLAVAQGLM